MTKRPKRSGAKLLRLACRRRSRGGRDRVHLGQIGKQPRQQISVGGQQGAYVDLALERGDAVRHEERLIVAEGAVQRRALAGSTAAVIQRRP